MNKKLFSILLLSGICFKLSAHMFDKQTGRLNQTAKEHLELAGIPLTQHYKSVPADHAKNVNQTLQKLCFEKDWDHFKKGGKAKINLSLPQAIAYLNREYTDRPSSMPKEKKELQLLIPGGEIPTMYKRFHSFNEFLKNGYSAKELFFLVKDDATKNSIEKLVADNEFASLFKDKKIHYIIAHTNLDIFSSCLEKIKDEKLITKDFALIADPMVAEKFSDMAAAALNSSQAQFKGAASVPFTNWEKEIELYGYTKTLGDKNKATIAWALSDLNFKARQAHAEYQALKENEFHPLN